MVARSSWSCYAKNLLTKEVVMSVYIKTADGLVLTHTGNSPVVKAVVADGKTICGKVSEPEVLKTTTLKEDTSNV